MTIGSARATNRDALPASATARLLPALLLLIAPEGRLGAARLGSQGFVAERTT